MTLDRATVEGMLATLRETGKFYADPADILEDWLRKEEALKAQEDWHAMAADDYNRRVVAEAELASAKELVDSLCCRRPHCLTALAAQAEEEKP